MKWTADGGSIRWGADPVQRAFRITLLPENTLPKRIAKSLSIRSPRLYFFSQPTKETGTEGDFSKKNYYNLVWLLVRIFQADNIISCDLSQENLSYFIKMDQP